MRLIDADALVERLGINEECKDCQYYHQFQSRCIRYDTSFTDVCEAIYDAPTVQPEVQLSLIEKALHGLSPEEQAEFLINLMRGTLAYIDSRAALIRWLESGCWNE